ncbi:MAG TPA: YciI family protein [Thermomicrobiales bacterium]|nr:YciI family protein [Thermomicrobiales bacterium]
MARFAVILTYGSDAERRLAIRPTHREYLKQLVNDGKLHGAGPWADDTGALLIYEAANDAEARAIFAADPYNEGGGGVVGHVEIKEWNRVIAAD